MILTGRIDVEKLIPPFFVGAWDGNGKSGNFMERLGPCYGIAAGAGANIRLMRLTCEQTQAPTILYQLGGNRNT